MNTAVTLILLLSFALSSQALVCWVCENAVSNSDCLARGRTQECQDNEEACFVSVRRGSFGLLVTKRCKQARACDNNFIQNPRAAWMPSQCNARTPSSVCRCCCASDLCNRLSLDCTINRADGGGFCDPIEAPRNGEKTCEVANFVLPNSIGFVEVGTECNFRCNPGYSLRGSIQSFCEADRFGGSPAFNRPVPECIANDCNVLSNPNNGRVQCTNENKISSRCTFSCDQSRGYELFPRRSGVLTCQNVGEWNRNPPCCARPCPPFAVMDLLLVLDSSSSIGEGNWLLLKAFVKSFIESFTYSTDFARLSVIRYNKEVDTASAIFLNSYVNDRTGLLAAYDAIPYNGSGTNTGKALEYVTDVLLQPENGDRPGVQNIVIVITDGRAQDEDLLQKEADMLDERDVLTYVVGIQPPKGSLDLNQLEIITGGRPNRVFEATGGFEALGDSLRTQISDAVCENRCS